MSPRVRAVTLLLAVAGAAAPLLAAEGRIPVWQPIQIVPAPNPGFNEGTYVVTRDVQAMPGLPIIDVNPNTVAVTIDLNGFTLYGLDQPVIRARGVDSVTIRNGTIMSGIDGIRAESCRKVVIEDVRIEFSQQYGIALFDVPSFALRRNVVVSTCFEAILVDGQLNDPATTSGSIEHNVITRAWRGIALYNGSSVAIVNNRIDTTTQADGIFIAQGPLGIIGCGACLIAENTIEEAFANGMWLAQFRGGKIVENEIISAGFNQGGEGLWLDMGSDDNLVLDNVISECGRNGVLVFSNGNHVERNVMNRNGVTFPPAFGLFLQGFANTYRGNTAQMNTGVPPACPGFPATTDFCNAGAGNNSPGDNFMPNAL
jgi:hypothetical protein